MSEEKKKPMQFVMLPVEAPYDTKVIFVKNKHKGYSLAKLDDLEELIKSVRRDVYKEVVKMYEDYTITGVRDVVKDRLKREV